MKDARDIIKKPVVTEKSMSMLEENKYTFVVAKDANKIEIKEAIEELFDVQVASVNTMITKGKIKRMGRTKGKRPDVKKAIVTVKEGSKIELFENIM